MAAKKFYAVKNGRHIGIFTSWEQCKQEVDGFPNAQYKGFAVKEEAQAYLDGSSGKSHEKNLLIDAAVAYVDGSYNDKLKIFGSGIVMLYQGKTEEFSLTFDDEDLLPMRNVAGEIKGAEFAMQFAKEHQLSKILIYYDYAGIEQWCTGGWKTNKPGTISYKALYDAMKETVDIQFCKVAAHTGVAMNERADELAKAGAKVCVNP